MKRRDFLRTAAVSSATLASGGLLRGLRAEESAPSAGNAARLPRRPYKDEVKLSIIGFPGFALKDVEQEQVNRIVAVSVERGINYFDVAPGYGDAEQRLGPALEPYRKQVFLATKTPRRDAAGAREELKQSLERLRTDHLDLYQLHYITDVEKDVDAAFARGGAMETLIEARKAGIVRYLGFSAHSVAAALAAMDRFDFDSALVPVNFTCAHNGNFGPQMVEAAREKGVTCIALKAMARHRWPSREDPQRKQFPHCWYQPVTDRREAALHLRYTLSQEVASAIPPADVSLLPLALDLGLSFKPIQPDELKTLENMTAEWEPVFRHG